MKNSLKMTLLAAVVATVGSGAALADNQQFRDLRAIQRAQAAQSGARTTIAVHDHRGVGRAEHRAEHPATSDQRRSGSRHQLRTNAHGEQFSVFVAE